jgi:uncharacterized DUF497 family protein
MRLEWDEAKRRSNIRWHGLDFADVEVVFAGETATFLDDRFDYGERRFHTYGLLRGTVVTLSHTVTDEAIRVISFRKASKNEEKLFFKEIRN